MSLPRNPNYQRPCYHCHSNEAAPHSNFCPSCRAGNKLIFMPPSKQTPVRTKLLILAAIGSTGWLIYKAAEVAMNP